MKLQLKILTLLLLNIGISKAFGQTGLVYRLERRLMNGDKDALFEIGSLFDSKNELIEFSGSQKIKTNEGLVAKRIVSENSIFTESEIVITEKTTAGEFLIFLKMNSDNIIFSKLANAFLITPLEDRSVKTEFRDISNIKEDRLRTTYRWIMETEWIQKTGIAPIILKRDPKALLLLASEFYKARNRSYVNDPEKYQYLELLQSLIELEIAVENEKKELIWQITAERSSAAALNLLIYFVKNYKDYKWDETKSAFKSNNVYFKPITEIEQLFDLTTSKNDSIAIGAFIKLTTYNTEKVISFTDEFRGRYIETNQTLPSNLCDFLNQIVVLTEYCRNNNIDFIGSPHLRADIDKLTNYLPFFVRRKLEDKLIETLNLNEITALEYWTLLRERNQYLAFSTGRIANIFYSKHWHQLLSDDKYLKLFLKKSFLFKKLPGGGICDRYLQKFWNNGSDVVNTLDQIRTDDKNIKEEIENARSFCLLPIRPLDYDTMQVPGHRDDNVEDIENTIRTVTRGSKSISNRVQGKLLKLLSQITYEQIGTAVREIEEINFEDNRRKKYAFIEDDWGFLIDGNFDSASTRKEFLAAYDRFSEYELYEYYLDKNQIDYKKIEGLLDYDKIFDILKYNIVISFIGFPGKNENEVYSIIKLLQLKHNTRLGYPKKRCSSGGEYYCDSEDEAQVWMRYLKLNNLLKRDHNEPMSFKSR